MDPDCDVSRRRSSSIGQRVYVFSGETMQSTNSLLQLSVGCAMSSIFVFVCFCAGVLCQCVCLCVAACVSSAFLSLSRFLFISSLLRFFHFWLCIIPTLLFKIFLRFSQRSSSPSSFRFGFVTELLATVRHETVGGHNFASWQVDFATITKRRQLCFQNPVPQDQCWVLSSPKTASASTCEHFVLSNPLRSQHWAWGERGMMS